MAPSKRSAPAARGRPAKIAAVDPTPTPAAAEPPCPLAGPQCPSPVEAVLDTFTSKAGCVEVFQAALPYVFATPAAQRHAFQANVLASFTAAIEEKERAFSDMLQAREAELAQIMASKAALSENLAQAEAVEASKAAAKTAAEEEERRAAAAKNEADATLAKAHTAKGSTAAAAQGKVDIIDKTTKTWADNFEAVKTGTFAPKEWRARNRSIEMVVGVLDSEAPTSLQLALEAALKERPEARGPFATEAVVKAEAAFHAYMQHLSTQLEELRSAETAATEAISAATAATSAAAAALEAAQQASIDAQNQWLAAASAVTDLKGRNFVSQEADASAAITKARESLEAFRRHAAACAALDQPPAPPAASTADVDNEASAGEPEVAADVTEQAQAAVPIAAAC